MNQLIAAGPQTPTPRPPQGRAVAQLLGRTEATMLAPWRELTATFEKHPNWSRATVAVAPSVEALRSTGRRGNEARRSADEILVGLPPAAHLRRLVASFAELEDSKPDPRQVRLLIAVMVDGFPNARPHNPEVYLEILVHEATAGGYRTATVAKACREIRQSATFLPTVAEFLKACVTADGARNWFPRLVLALDHRLETERRVHEAERLGPATEPALDLAHGPLCRDRPLGAPAGPSAPERI